MIRDSGLERKFQDLVVKEGQRVGGFTFNFKANKVRAMKQHVGKSLWMTYVQRPSFTRVELYIYRGPDNYDETFELFEKFHEHKSEINAAFGRKLNWDADPEKNACRIEVTYNGFDLHNQSCWDDFAKRMVSDMNKLNYALEPHYSNL
tara:strand:+ start:171 stop:614 length:444 start_codon:yes stop_codon:yes gene_type:complete